MNRHEYPELTVAEYRRNALRIARDYLRAARKLYDLRAERPGYAKEASYFVRSAMIARAESRGWRCLRP